MKTYSAANVREWAEESTATDATDEAEIDICSAVDIIIISVAEGDLYNKVAAGLNNSWWYRCGCTNR